MSLDEIKKRILDLGIEKMNRKLDRLEGRRFFLFLRLRLLAMKLRFLQRL